MYYADVQQAIALGMASTGSLFGASILARAYGERRRVKFHCILEDSIYRANATFSATPSPCTIR